MPWDKDAELAEIRQRSRLWYAAWVAGDLAYYHGLVGVTCMVRR